MDDRAGSFRIDMGTRLSPRAVATWVAILVTLLMCGVGMLIALVTDIILKAVGMDVSKIEHHE